MATAVKRQHEPQRLTLSVGQIAVGDEMISYHGTQTLTKDNPGRAVYGGSDLVCVRGGWKALAELPMTKKVRVGIEQAITYETAMDAYPGFMASRRNYDVGQGLDAQGRWRSGVFESSWRSGGASTAELAALTAFAEDPGLRVFNLCSIKEYGNGHQPPPHATVHFRGNDPQDGPMIRYTVATLGLLERSNRLRRSNGTRRPQANGAALPVRKSTVDEPQRRRSAARSARRLSHARMR
jgi:Protein of unknown function (DUF3182)